MGTLVLIKSLFVICAIGWASGAMNVKPKVKEKAESLYSSNALHGPTGNPKDIPVFELSTCIERVFGIPFPSPPTTTTSTTMSTTTTTTTTTTSPERCIYTDGDGNPEVRTQEEHRQRRSLKLKDALSEFHDCICLTVIEQSHDHPCIFDMMEIGYNRSVLSSSLGNDTKRARLTYRSHEFHCRLKRDFTLACRIKDPKVSDNGQAITFQETMVCMSNALEPFVCDAVQSTPPNQPVITTGSTASASFGGKSLPVGFIILILGCLLCLLLGILGTVCGVVCYRRRRKRTKAKSIVKRTGRQAQLNSYSGNVPEQHIYDELPDAPVPDLLQQNPTGPVHSRFGSERSIAINAGLCTVSYSPTVRENGYYEPLSRRDNVYNDERPLPAKPIPKPRWQFSVPDGASSGPHDYLDLVEESKLEEEARQEAENPDNPYFVLEPDESKPMLSEKSPEEHHKGEYVQLRDGGQASSGKEPSKDIDTSSDKDSMDCEVLNRNSASSVHSEATAHDYFILEKTGGDEADNVQHDSSSSSESSDFVIVNRLDAEEPEVTEASRFLDDDQYEVPVAEVTGFDLASSFKVTEGKGGRGKRRYKDYQTILPVVGEAASDKRENDAQNPKSFVLES